MKINDDAPVPTTATQPAKLLWTTPRVITIGEAEGKTVPTQNETITPYYGAGTS